MPSGTPKSGRPLGGPAMATTTVDGHTVPDPSARTTGPGPRVLLVCALDDASRNIADKIRRRTRWEDTGASYAGCAIERLVTVDDAPTPRQDVLLATIEDWHIEHDGLGEGLSRALGQPIEAILVLSRHRAASGQRSFTTHPVGNATSADAGGLPGTATPTHPGLLSACYRALIEHSGPSDVEHMTSLEATHHGPTTGVPIVFIEIGSDERYYDDPTCGRIVADAALDAVLHAPSHGRFVVMGFGGGHYAPRLGAILEESDADVGHMLPAYHWKDRGGVPLDVVDAFLAAGAEPGKHLPDAIYIDHKSIPNPARTELLEHLEALGLHRVRTKDLVAKVPPR